MSLQDDLDNELTPEQALSKFNHNEINWPPITPLKTGLLPVKSIVPDMLPKSLSGWLVDTAERMDNGPLEYAAVTAMVISGTLVGRKIGVRPKQQDDWTVIPNLWGCCVGPPSYKKSPVMKSIMRPLERMEKAARDRYQQEYGAFEVKSRINKLATQQAELDAKKLLKGKHYAEAEALLTDDSSDPKEPTPRRYIIHDGTVEKIGILLSKNPWGFLQYRDEISALLNGLCRDDQQQNRAFMLESFNGDGSFSYDRISRDDVYIPSNTLSVLGGIQPSRLLPLLINQKDVFGGDGLIDRMQLMVYPDKPHFRYVDRSPDYDLQKQAYSVFESLDAIPYQGEEDIPYLRFDEQAQELFQDWYLALHKKIELAGGKQIANHLSKYASLMPSLALIFHLISYGASGAINKQCAEMAIRWCEVLETHVRRVYALIDDPLIAAKTLLSRLKQLNSPFKMATLERKDWIGLRERSERDFALTQLEDHGYIVCIESYNGGRPSIDYHINPAFLCKEDE